LSVWLLAAATLVCLLPFVGKAFHMDDPLFIWTARHLQSHPFDFYGFNVDWSFQTKPMSLETQNPPLAAYYLALVGTAFGWGERALHIGFLFPAFALVLGTYFLARRFCSHPFAAALATISTPVFLLSSTSLMCDTMMVALWVWAILLWMAGLDPENPRRLLLAALLISVASLTKYFGLCLVPLLVVYSALQRHCLGRWLIYFAVPLGVMAAYQWLTIGLYGHGLLSGASNYIVTNRTGVEGFSRIIETFIFGGGCVLIALATLPLLWGGKGILLGASGAAAAGCLMVAMAKVGVFSVVADGHVQWLFLMHATIFLVGGAVIVVLAILDAWRNRTPASILLLLWVAGTLFFVGLINWTVSGRNFLPLAPAAALLIVRHLEIVPGGRLRYFWYPLGISLSVALMVAWADWKLAGSARAAAASFKSQLADRFHPVSFEGHWGFQYYMEEWGAKPLEHDPLTLTPGQAVVVPLGNTCIFDLPYDRVDTLSVDHPVPAKWLSIQSVRAGAGYYSDISGPAPFVFGPAFPESYWVFRVK
jgi:4-amino-4-deoxy-L-arabinose transferase-like glycosyltransferase